MKKLIVGSMLMLSVVTSGGVFAGQCPAASYFFTSGQFNPGTTWTMTYNAGGLSPTPTNMAYLIGAYLANSSGFIQCSYSATGNSVIQFFVLRTGGSNNQPVTSDNWTARSQGGAGMDYGCPPGNTRLPVNQERDPSYCAWQ